MEKPMRTAQSRAVPVCRLQLVLPASSRRLLFGVATALVSACGSRAVDLDGSDGGSVNVNSNPDAIAPGVSAFLEDQKNAIKIVVDEKRVYWLELFPMAFGSPEATTSAGVRSCLKSECRSTITTYDSATYSLGVQPSPPQYVALAAAGDNVYWAQNLLWTPSSSDPLLRRILTCPSAGCVGEPRVIASSVHLTSLAADESHVYWTSPQDSGVFRLPVSKPGVPEKIVLNETDPDHLVLNGSHVYWIERAGVANAAIKRVLKQGGEPVETLAMAQNQATALSVDSEFVYWANTYSVGGILRCKLSGCPSGPEVMVANQPWVGTVVANGLWIFWITSLDAPIEGAQRVQQAWVKRCPVDGCASAVETLAVQTFDPRGMSMVADGSDLYWVAQGLSDPPSYATFPHATIYRHKN
jgi:hypothetical protein